AVGTLTIVTDPTSSIPIPKAENDGPPQKFASWNERARSLNKSKTASYNAQSLPKSQLSVVIPVKPIPPDAKILDMDSITRTRLRDQKEEADAALVKLQDLLHEVFEAEDQLELGSEKSTAVFSVAN